VVRGIKCIPPFYISPNPNLRFTLTNIFEKWERWSPQANGHRLSMYCVGAGLAIVMLETGFVRGIVVVGI